MVEKIIGIEKKFNFSKIYQKVFVLFLKPKVVHLRPFLSSLPFPKFEKQNFIYFGHKHVETGPNSSHELATFLKHHMPLRG